MREIDANLFEAIKNNDLSQLKIILEKGGNIDVKSGEKSFDCNEDWTPLFYAIANNKTDIAKYLIESGSDLFVVTNTNTNYLMFACSRGHFEIVKSLLDKKIFNLNDKSENGFTALHFSTFNIGKSTQENYCEIIKMLLNTGANVNAKDNAGDTPLHSAASNLLTNIAYVLIQNGAIVNAENNKGGTPLGIAISSLEKDDSNSLATIKLLLEKGANVNLYYDGTFCKAIDFATEFKFNNLERLLKEYNSRTGFAETNKTQPSNICPKCNSTYDQSRKFCGKCGVPLVAAGTSAPSAPDISPSPEDAPQFPSSTATSSSKGPIIGIAAVIAILVVGYFGYDFFIAKRNFLGKIDGALSAGRYFSPPGDNVEEIFKAQRAKSPESKELKQAGEKIRVKFQQEGDSALQRFYNDSDEMGWENIVRMYGFLNEIISEDREIQARAEFSKAHNIIKGGRRSDYSEALSRYQKALELKPNWVFAINGIAKVYVRKNSPFYNKAEALNYYNRACEVDPNFPWAYTNIAAIYAEDRNWEMAEQALQKALNLKKDRPSILIELGNLCEKQKKKQEAINYYQEALKYEKNPEKINWLQKRINTIPATSMKEGSNTNQRAMTGYLTS